jgi:kynurenine formamidase
MNVFYQNPGEFHKGDPGIGVDAAKYLIQKDVCAVGADNVTVEVRPDKAGRDFPVHVELIRNHGIYLMEMLVLDKLAQSGRFEFMFVAAPLKISRGVGSPINPLAII